MLTSYLKTSNVIEMVGETKPSDHPERDWQDICSIVRGIYTPLKPRPKTPDMMDIDGVVTWLHLSLKF